MTLWFRPRIRHPFFPALTLTPVTEARGCALALSGTYAELERAAARGVSAQRIVFVLLDWNAPAFTVAQRDRLWDLFQTPIYCILLGLDGRVAGYECEALSGFHMPGNDGGDTAGVCECGRGRISNDVANGNDRSVTSLEIDGKPSLS